MNVAWKPAFFATSLTISRYEAHVDLVLRWADLVMDVFDRDSHAL
jgi:hypothetical protein